MLKKRTQGKLQYTKHKTKPKNLATLTQPKSGFDGALG